MVIRQCFIGSSNGEELRVRDEPQACAHCGCYDGGDIATLTMIPDFSTYANHCPPPDSQHHAAIACAAMELPGCANL